MSRSFLILGLVAATIAKAQDPFSYKSLTVKIAPWQSGQFGDNSTEIIQWDANWSAPEPAGDHEEAKRKVNALRAAYDQRFNKVTGYSGTSADFKPKVDTSFNGQIIGSRGIPNDNHMAISNSGKIVSVQNSSLRVLDVNGNSLMYKTLYQFANGKVVGLTNYCYDPKVVYDPLSDRFILFFLHESKVATNFGVLAFSQTNDPAGAWNFYKIPGNAIKNDKWSDYPIMAISKEDVFVTLNLLTENTDWRVGFNQSLIWQINKASGYKGDTLTQKVYYDIRYKNKAVWSICPVQGSNGPTSPAMYFLSVRPGDLQNDTLFLHEITNTLRSGAAGLKLRVLTTTKKYGVPPAVPQPKGGDTLQTNDTRVLGGMIHNNIIQYVQTSVAGSNYRSGVFHGMFHVLNDNIAEANLLYSDTQDFAYPSIAYAGKGGGNDQASVITFSHVSLKSYPGTSAIYHTRVYPLKSVFSEPVRVKNGVSFIERLPVGQYPQERWGDYTGIQMKYDEPGVVWLCGSYGNESSQNGTWIGKLKVIESVGLQTDGELSVYPNPSASGKVTAGIYLEEKTEINVGVYDQLGQLVREVYSGTMDSGYSEVSFDNTAMAHGIYYMLVTSGNGKKLYSAKLIK